MEEYESYGKVPVDKLLDYIVENWEDEDKVWVGPALDLYYDKVRKPRDWVDINQFTIALWERMFGEKIETDSPMYGVIVSAISAANSGAWDTIAEAFGLNSRYVELVLAEWYERDLDKPPPPPITWGQFMERYEKEKDEWEEWKNRNAPKET